MPIYIEATFQALKSRFLGFSCEKAHWILEALRRLSPFPEDRCKTREVEIPTERADYLQRRADYWSHAMGIDPPKLQFHEGLHTSGNATGTYLLVMRLLRDKADEACCERRES